MRYFDANATEPLHPEARAVLMKAFELTGNPSSVHGSGRAARAVVEDARETLAERFGARPEDVVMTSGGTEADALAIYALGGTGRIVIGATEHDAIRSAAPTATVLPVDAEGVIEMAELERVLTKERPALVCLMLANNETGTLLPVREAAALCRAHGARLHVDAVQAAGRMPVDIAALGADSLAVSSHKLGGPAGVGALVLRSEVSGIAPLIRGGGQERGRRGGTPPVAAIAGFAAAAKLDYPAARIGRLRDEIEREAVANGAIVCGGAGARLPNTTCLALPGVRADLQVIALDLEGFAVSAGAACSSGKVGESHVLAAMGLGTLAGQAIRVSLPWNVSGDDARAFCGAYADMANRLRRLVASAAA